MVAEIRGQVSVLNSLSRRDALRWTAATLAASVAGARWLLPGASGGLGPATDKLRLGQFLPLLGDEVRVGLGSGATLGLTLTEARDLWRASRGVATSDVSPEYFSLLFSGPVDGPMNQGSYRFEHTVLGALWLFVVPMATDGREQLYEAIINQQRAADEPR